MSWRDHLTGAEKELAAIDRTKKEGQAQARRIYDRCRKRMKGSNDPLHTLCSQLPERRCDGLMPYIWAGIALCCHAAGMERCGFLWSLHHGRNLLVGAMNSRPSPYQRKDHPWIS